MKTFKYMAMALVMMMSTTMFANTNVNHKKSNKTENCIECRKNAQTLDRHHMRGQLMDCMCMAQMRKHVHDNRCKCDCHKTTKLCKKHEKMAKHDRPQVLPEYDHPVAHSTSSVQANPNSSVQAPATNVKQGRR